MNNINPIYSSNIGYIPHFKASEENKTVTNPIKEQEINDLQGFNALANYNLSMLANNKNIDIPVLTFPNIETDINKIKGEKIYNSNGTLIRIVDENDSYKKDYNIVDNKLEWHTNFDKKTGEKLSVGYFNDNGSCDSVFITYPDGIRVDNRYDEYGNITYKRKEFPDGRNYSYDYTDKQYISNKYTKNAMYEIILDKDKNYKRAKVSGEKTYPNYEVKFYNNKPYKVNIEASKNLPNKIIDKDLVDLKDFEPTQFENFNIEEIQNIDGEKKFYSDGKLEEVITKDGTIYQLDYDQKDLVVKKGNKKINKNIDDYRTMTKITENLENGKEKITRYSDILDSTSVEVKDGNSSKWVEYSNNGNIYYSENVDGKDIFKIVYDKDGNLLNYNTGYGK